ncbi:hypothetical protein HPC49_35250 [Pyxidicoccus fallax]|uniref:Lipoprotein n=1 Tax=Pyxidicoccus fallax TaxID=394095 RepID=A0A848LX83_9BACT|nr:hypothetical protein [Pyxidicoccus fallax]NMO22003.1 hypothetical protein [Pyxidicoccus fallax]NPC83468.1 hypothetical protein [Pyxidicoccus fallax]
MRPRLLLCSLMLSLLAAACRRAPPPLVPTAARPPPVRLEFQPPVDRVLTETVRAIRVVERGGTSVREEAEATTETRFTPSEGGWLLAQVVPRSRLVRGGADAGTEVDTWVDNVLARFTLRVRLAADGTFVGLVSAESALEALRQVVPAGAPDLAVLERFFSPEALEARMRREWEAKYAGLFARNLMEGQRIWSVDVLPMGETQVAYVLERTVQGTRDTDYGDALVLTLRCLGTLPEGSPDELTDAWEAAGKPQLTPGVTCEGEQVVARGRFVPVSRELTVKATVAGESWTVTTQSRAQSLQEEAR